MNIPNVAVVAFDDRVPPGDIWTLHKLNGVKVCHPDWRDAMFMKAYSEGGHLIVADRTLRKKVKIHLDREARKDRLPGPRAGLQERQRVDEWTKFMTRGQIPEDLQAGLGIGTPKAKDAPVAGNRKSPKKVYE